MSRSLSFKETKHGKRLVEGKVAYQIYPKALRIAMVMALGI